MVTAEKRKLALDENERIAAGGRSDPILPAPELQVEYLFSLAVGVRLTHLQQSKK
jgi:hypothetical protein